MQKFPSFLSERNCFNHLKESVGKAFTTLLMTSPLPPLTAGLPPTRNPKYKPIPKAKCKTLINMTILFELVFSELIMTG